MYFHGDRNKKEIALTFDDGPSKETELVLKTLKKYDIKATFFIVGKMVEGREHILEQAKKDGHEFGNHTFTHKRLWFRSKKFIQGEIKKCDDALAKSGIVTDLVRFPGLKFGYNALTVCKKLQKKIIFADFLSINQFAYDWFRPWLKKKGILKGSIKIDDVTTYTLRKTRNGSILDFHDYLQEIGSHSELINILEEIIPRLQAKGFKFKKVSELL